MQRGHTTYDPSGPGVGPCAPLRLRLKFDAEKFSSFRPNSGDSGEGDLDEDRPPRDATGTGAAKVALACVLLDAQVEYKASGLLATCAQPESPSCDTCHSSSATAAVPVAGRMWQGAFSAAECRSNSAILRAAKLDYTLCIKILKSTRGG